tara:strand:- start:1837 stop:2415 length:579 start_codon:yes stop_codon:yes gene_type:complete
MSLTLSTELEAVNQMLSAIGEAPINQLDTATTADARVAKQILDEVSRDVQSRGWHFNTEPEYTITKDGNGHINLPATAVRFDIKTELYPTLDIVQRGNKMYDRKGHSFVFTQDLKGEIVLLLDFTDLPQPARNYITVRASRIFQDRVVGSQDLLRVLAADEATALATLKDYDDETADYTIFDNLDAYNVINR